MNSCERSTKRWPERKKSSAKTFKMSASQWLRHRYDVRTQVQLSDEEVVGHGPFAQVIRYQGPKTRNKSWIGGL